SRHAPTSFSPSMWHSVGMRRPASRTASRIVLPSSVGASSPSIRMVIFFGIGSTPDIAPQTAAGFFRGVLRGERQYHLVVALDAQHRDQFLALMPRALARLAGRLLAVVEPSEKLVEALFAHQPLVHLPRRFLAEAHRVRHVGRAGDDVAAR